MLMDFYFNTQRFKSEDTLNSAKEGYLMIRHPKVLSWTHFPYLAAYSEDDLFLNFLIPIVSVLLGLKSLLYYLKLDFFFLA
jgi:hypothetical protein